MGLKRPCVTGSSPLTRGKLHVGHLLTWYLGLIPAHAGKTSGAAQPSGTNAAHPRSRGENCDADDFETVAQGSSPLTRGKLARHGPAYDRYRLIPAHAGKTRVSRIAREAAKAHPRSRGENPGRHSRWCRFRGSSPLTRGKRGRCPGCR